MWRSYDPAVVREELRVLREHGLTMTRSFFYWPDFMPEPDVIDEDMAARFADFLDRHAEQDMSTVPTFIVGHMSGENWDPAWRAGRDLYSDVWMVGRQAWFAGEMVRRFGAHLAVAGWLVSNEMPLYGGDHTPHESWPPGPRSSGTRCARPAAASPSRSATAPGASRRPAATTGSGSPMPPGMCDFIGPHVYPVGDDQIRQHYAAAWQCELASTFGKPVVLEEFGVSSDFAVGAERRPLLPARPAQQPAGRRDRLDRVEQHRLRPARPGPVPAPRLRAALRPHRRGRRSPSRRWPRCGRSRPRWTRSR